MPYNYATKDYAKEHMARTVGIALPISTKQSIEICSLLRNKDVAYAKRMLNDIISMKKALPLKRFNKNVGHKPGIGPGRYPQKSCQAVLSLLEGVEANAQFKGLDTSSLVISHMCAHRAGKVMHHGRQSGTTAKRTHLEIIVKESAKKDKKKQDKKTESKPKETKESKNDAKKEDKK